jgi:phytoene synthase
MSTLTSTDGAYRHCEAITRSQAANFYYGIRLLTGSQRAAMCAVYAFARRIDDIGDGTLQTTEKQRLLDEQARALAAIADGAAGADADADADGDLVMVALNDACARFALPLDALGELIEGVRMDVAGVTYESFEELLLYCQRVAGAIGRVCAMIFGGPHGAPLQPSAGALADDLGVALQLTNILRDVREDALNDRVYLPREDLRRFGLLPAAPEAGHAEALAALKRAVGGSDPEMLEQLTELVRFEGARAEEWFARIPALDGLLDRRSAACVMAMAGIYRRVLGRIEADPARVARTRISLPAYEKAWVAARGMLGVGW